MDLHWSSSFRIVTATVKGKEVRVRGKTRKEREGSKGMLGNEGTEEMERWCGTEGNRGKEVSEGMGR